MMDILHWSLIACLIVLSLISITLVIFVVRHQNAFDWMFSERVMMMDSRVSDIEEALDLPANGVRRASPRTFQSGEALNTSVEVFSGETT